MNTNIQVFRTKACARTIILTILCVMSYDKSTTFYFGGTMNWCCIYSVKNSVFMWEVYRIDFVGKRDVFETLRTTFFLYNILPISPSPPEKNTRSCRCESRRLILLHVCNRYPINHHQVP